MTRRLLSIATLYPAPQRPGFGRFVSRQMEALAARGDWDVTVVNPIGLPPLPLKRYAKLMAIPPVEQAGSVTVHHPRFTLIPGLSGRFNPALITRAILPLVRRLHAAQPFDMVDAQFFYPDGPAAARIAGALGLPFAMKARGSDIHYWGERASALRQMRDASASASAVLSVSAALGRDMAVLGLETGHLQVHYTGLDRQRFRPLPRAEARQSVASLGIATDGPLVVSVGALVPVKGLDLAIRAMAHLPAAVRLVIVGEGSQDQALRALAESCGVAAKVRFLGNVGHDVLPALLSAADAMVLPSEREGLANAWIEALACGTPVVIPDIGGAREVVRNPAAGRLVERDPAAIARGLEDVIAARTPQDKIAACAANFSWEENAARLAEIYESVVAAR
ncbi:glycosyltransferase [Novosphingobium sp. KCTC 2891]|uniref:glycosyltransferase n=1 Tax=Novosphingobium sp. KCTC 2891 TaxID=2989730 RepID=UPI002223E6A5|nr:glycosyltransferase [Novosphingobium sp. KCTC 2891]MCW1384105.1 glycosyltransferase [Novosphingobium sp. KCTC 2891]